MPLLENGDVIASFLSATTSKKAWDGGVLDDIKLHRGEVKDIIYPNDKRSRSKRSIEYVVYAQRNNNYTKTTQEFRCVAATPFGGVADKVQYTLRKDTTGAKRKEAIGNGSKVVFLCINGEKHRGLILSGVRDDNDSAQLDADKLGHHYYANFNGVSAYIDQDGQFVLTYGGKTSADGKTDVDASVRGTAMSYLKDGSWNIATTDPNDSTKHEQFMFLDHNDHTTTHQAHSEWLTQVVSGPAKIKSRDGLKIGDATDHMLLGESFRQAQSQMNKTLKQLIQQCAIQLNAAGAAMVTPITGAVAAAPSITAAGALLQAAAQVIDAFEQQAAAKNSFLSRNNQSD